MSPSPRFHLQASVASTGLNHVWRAYDHFLNAEIALKRPKKAQSTLEREIEALGHIHHAHVVTLLDHGTDDDGPFLCLGWIPGSTLDTCLTTAPLTEEATVRLLRQLLDALAATHEAGFVHGDLKAENVILAPLDTVILIDFGNATRIGAPPPDKVGSLHQMAPELFASAPRSAATDLYALGVMAYQCLSGRLPFQGDTQAQVIAAHHRHWRTPLTDLCTVSPGLENWVERMTAANSQERPETAAAAMTSLKQALHSGD